MKLSLRNQMILSLVFISIFSGLAFYVINAYMFQKQFQTYMTEHQDIKNEEIRQTIINAYGHHGSTPDIEFFRNFGEMLLDQKILLSVYDKTGKEIFCIYCESHEKCNHVISHAEEVMKEFNPGFRGEFIEKELSITKDGVNLGRIKLGYYGPFFYDISEQNFVKSYNQFFIILSIIIVGFSVGLGIISASRIVKPIKKVIEKTKDISDGNYIDKIEVKSVVKEIDELAGSINHLTNNLNNQLKIKKQMAGDFAHEFLTPLTTLKGNIEAIIDGVYDASPERLDSIKLEVERLARMIYDIDKLVDINSDLKLKKISFDLSEEIAHVLTLFEKEIKEKKIKINFKNKQQMLFADKDKINQLLINLISNSIKYSNQKGLINIEIKNSKNKLIFTIADTGIGIKKEELPFIFEYLYRTDKSRSRNTGGTGIGLYVVKNIVEAHDGIIEVESEFNGGTMFIITLPNNF